MKRCSIIPATLLAVTAFTSVPASTAGESVDIVIRKEAAKDVRSSTQGVVRHTVRSGETLGGILRERGFLLDELPAAIKAVLELNPALANPQFILAGQEIVLPDSRVGLGTRDAGAGRAVEKRYPEVSHDAGVGDLAAAGRLRPLLDSTLRQLDETLNQSGTLHLPLGALGTIDIDGSAYPLVEFSTGKAVLLDVGGTLPEDWSSMIPEFWPSYGVMASGAKSDLLTFLTDMFTMSGFHSVIPGEPFSIGREASVTIVPDFLILKGPRSLMEGDIFMLNVDESPDLSLPDEIKALAADHRIRVIDVVPSADDYAPPVETTYDRHYALKITSSSRRLLFQELASFLGFSIDNRHSLPRETPGDGIAFSPRESLLISREGRRCLLHFTRGGNAFDMISEAQLSPVYAGSGEPLLPAVRNVLDVLDIDFSGPAIEFYRTRDRYRITVPGLYLSGTAKPFFITDRDIGDHLFSYLEASGIDVILLVMTNE